MKVFSLMTGILMMLTILSCESENIDCNYFNKELNDTVGYESKFENTIYSLDIDSNGEVDVEFILHLQTSIGGNACSIKLKSKNEMLFVESKIKLVHICQDTLNWNLDPSVEYYQNINCNDEVNSIRTDTIVMSNIFQDEDIEDIETLLTPKTEVLIYSHDGIGADGIYPGAIFNNITSNSFEASNSSGWLIFEKENNELYGLKISMELINNCQPINILELRRIDCE